MSITFLTFIQFIPKSFEYTFEISADQCSVSSWNVSQLADSADRLIGLLLSLSGHGLGHELSTGSLVIQSLRGTYLYIDNRKTQTPLSPIEAKLKLVNYGRKYHELLGCP